MSKCLAGCCPHDSALPEEGCPRDLSDAPVTERIVHLRSCQLLPVARIAALTGIDRQRVTRLLFDAVSGPGGAGRFPLGRAGEEDWLDVVTAPLSGRAGTAVARTRRRSGRGPSEAELLTALYADPDVCQVLDKHGIPVATLGGPAWKRFPAPQPLSADLVSDLYQGCGLGLHHIELLTGRPAAAVGAVLRAKGIRLRAAGGTSPFTRRLRQDQRQNTAR